jgi:3-oxoacyl-[acyl-carrier-protein] synthase II
MRRVVVTGVGAVSPCGLDTEATWAAIREGKSGIGPITNFDASQYTSRIAGECSGFDAEAYVEKKKIKEGDRFIHLALGASTLAVKSAGFEPNDAQRERVGTFIGVGLFGLGFAEKAHGTLVEKGPSKVSPYFMPGVLANLAPGQVSMKFGFKGPSYTHTSACASGAHAIGDAVRWIQTGEIDAALAGGAEAAVTALGTVGFTALRALSTRNEDPTKASRPFDRGRDGFVIAEGSGILMLEERELALKRGAPILAEFVGYGATSDAHHLTQPAPEGEGARRAMEMSLRSARRNASEVDYVNAHGTSTPFGDQQEARAIYAAIGQHNPKLWVSSTKSMTGHLLGAAGGLEAVLSVLAIRDGIAINLDDPDVDNLDLVPHTARERALDLVVSNSFGFGGTNCSLAFARHE